MLSLALNRFLLCFYFGKKNDFSFQIWFWWNSSTPLLGSWTKKKNYLHSPNGVSKLISLEHKTVFPLWDAPKWLLLMINDKGNSTEKLITETLLWNENSNVVALEGHWTHLPPSRISCSLLMHRFGQGQAVIYLPAAFLWQEQGWQRQRWCSLGLPSSVGHSKGWNCSHLSEHSSRS